MGYPVAYRAGAYLPGNPAPLARGLRRSESQARAFLEGSRYDALLDKTFVPASADRAIGTKAEILGLLDDLEVRRSAREWTAILDTLDPLTAPLHLAYLLVMFTIGATLAERNLTRRMAG